MKGEPKPDYNWLISSRHKASELLYGLHQISEQLSGEISKDHQALFENLVGAAFSLWRAAFLAHEREELWPKSLVAATELLKELLSHNRIGYEQEKNQFAWFCRFYLKSAELRIDRVVKHFMAKDFQVDLKQCEAVQRILERIDDQKAAAEEKPTERWNDAHEAADFLVKELRKQVS